MSYNIQSQILPNGQMLLYESNSGSSVILKACPEDLYMVYCDTGNSKTIEYPLLQEFFETAALEFELEERFGTSEEKGKSYSGCMLGVSRADELLLLSALNKANAKWCNDTTQDELYIIVGEDLSDVDVAIIDSLKGKWHKAKIFTWQGFLNFIKNGKSDDAIRKNFNNFIKHCIFAADGYFKWPHTNIYPGKGLFNPTKELMQIGVLAMMGYHVGRVHGIGDFLRHEILKSAYISDIPFVECDYMKAWSVPKTHWRLKKIAYCLASFAKNAKRKSNWYSYSQCIEEWEDDLAWLKRNFYDGVYDSKFEWPDWSE